MKKTKKTLIISSVVLLGWLPTAAIASNVAYTANAAVVGSAQNNRQSNNNQRNNNQNKANENNNNNNFNQANNNNNQPVNNNQNNNYQNNNQTNSNSNGLSNVQELPSGSVVHLAGPSGFVYSLYSVSGQKASRGLAGDTAWVTDKSATDSSGNTYYRVSTDEWVRADSGVSLT